MKSRSFFSGLSLLLILNFAIKPVWIFFIDREVQNLAGHSAYGNYFAILNLSIVLSFLADAGLTNMMNQRIADKSPVHFAHYFRIKLVLIFSYLLSCCVAGLIFHISQWKILLYVLLIQSFNSLFVFLRAVITGHQRYKADAWFSIIDKSLMILICGSFLYLPFLREGFNLLMFLQIQLGCTVLAFLIAMVFIYRHRLFTKAVRERSIMVAGYLLPFTLIYLLMSVHYRLDGFLLERMQGAFEAGIYASAYRLLDAGNMVGYLAASFLVPFIARHAADRKLLASTLLTVRHALLFIAALAVSFCFVFSSFLQRWLYHSADAYNAEVIRWCLLSLPGYYLVHIYGSVFTAIRRFRVFILLLVAAVFINVALNILLIPLYGALGCCFAALASELFCGLGCWFAASRLLAFSIRPVHLFSYLALGLGWYLFFLLAGQWIESPLVIVTLVAGLLLLVFALQFRRIQNYLLTLQ